MNLRYLFTTFLKIGMVSFGGHMALIAVVQREMVEKDQTLDEEVIIDAISIASLLPGPVAVNVVAYIGHHLQGKKGAAVSMFAILLPACTLMFILSWCYFRFAYKAHLAEIMVYTAGAVSAIILSTGVNMYKKEIHGNTVKIILCVLATLLVFFVKGYFITLGLILLGGLTGFMLNPDNKEHSKQTGQQVQKSNFKLSLLNKLLLLGIGAIEIAFITNASSFINNIFLKIVSVFSGISLSLFGGGYVIVPIMQSLLVEDLKWLNNQQFIDGITFSQVTPGPILISALFAGYKLAGFIGGALAIAAIFIPSAILMLIVSSIFRRNKQHRVMKNILAGIKPVVVGMIIASSIKLLQSVQPGIVIIPIAIIAFLLSYRFKLSPVYLITGSLFLGLIINYSHFSI